MDKDRIKGSARQAKGALKEVVGKVTGDAKLEAEGKSDKVASKAQNAVAASRMRFAASNGSVQSPAGAFFFSLHDPAGKILNENFYAGRGGACQICH